MAATISAAASDHLAVQEPQTQSLRLGKGTQALLRSAKQIHRSTVADPSVCGVNHFTSSELAIVARSPGSTEVTVWFTDNERPPLIYIVEVR